MEPNRARSIIEAYLEAYNRFDIENMLVFLHSSIVFQNVSGGNIQVEAHGCEDSRQWATQST